MCSAILWKNITKTFVSETTWGWDQLSCEWGSEVQATFWWWKHSLCLCEGQSMGQIHISGQTGLFTNRRKNTCLCGLVSKDQAHKVRSEKAGGAVSLGSYSWLLLGPCAHSFMHLYGCMNHIQVSSWTVTFLYFTYLFLQYLQNIFSLCPVIIQLIKQFVYFLTHSLATQWQNKKTWSRTKREERRIDPKVVTCY